MRHAGTLRGWTRWRHAVRVPSLAFALLTAAGTGSGQNLWDLFSRDYVTNVQAWTRHNDNPVISPSGSTWKSRWTANPEFLSFEGRTLLFYRGNGALPGSGQAFHDRIGVAEVSDVGPMRLGFRDLNNGLPVVDGGAPGQFDADDVRDPAAIVFGGKILLYYSAIGAEQNSIGLASSTNGEKFMKVGKVLDGRSPDVVLLGDTLFMVYQKRDSVGYKVYLAFSMDGQKFLPMGNKPVFTGTEGRWDGKSVTTPRLWRSGAWFYMMYGGSTDFVDEPEYFGLARSRDLMYWEPHPGNPVFGAGARGSPDGGAIWFPAVYEAGSWIVLLYEGSRGRYGWDLLSSICMAWIAIH